MKPKEVSTMMKNKKNSLELLTMELEKINSTLWNPKGGKGAKSKEVKELEVHDLAKIATSLANALNSVKTVLEEDEESRKTLMEDNLKRMEALEQKEEQLEEKMRKLEDMSDHHHQRSLKGETVHHFNQGEQLSPVGKGVGGSWYVGGEARGGPGGEEARREGEEGGHQVVSPHKDWAELNDENDNGFF